ncbi:MAG: helix-turn-helix transcriptional regulator [Anaerovoracaceae bacterium]|jgi:predicted DNA-binding transcriptional regulator YafY
MGNAQERISRILRLQQHLSGGAVINKKTFAQKNGITEKTVQRDVSMLNNFYQDLVINGEAARMIEYSRKDNGYRLIDSAKLTKENILAISKILLESRAFNKNELNDMLDKLLSQVGRNDRIGIKELINDDRFYYVPLCHGKDLQDLMYDLSGFIRQHEKIEIDYAKMDGEKVKRKVRPVSVLFSEFYFYLLAFRDDEKYETPTVYRLDRIINCKTVGEKFYIPHTSKFHDGELRKYVQFMYPGKLQKIKFQFTGKTIEPVLDRLPTARVTSQEQDVYVVEAEVFGEGIEMWMRSQGGCIKGL